MLRFNHRNGVEMKNENITEYEQDDLPEPELTPFIPEFIEDRLLEISQMYGFIQESNFDQIKKNAHKWKGILKPYGFSGITNKVFHLEGITDERDSEQIKATLQEIEGYFKYKSKNLKN